MPRLFVWNGSGAHTFPTMASLFLSLTPCPLLLAEDGPSLEGGRRGLPGPAPSAAWGPGPPGWGLGGCRGPAWVSPLRAAR